MTHKLVIIYEKVFNPYSMLGLLDIYNTVKELRSRRVNMVANLEQYIFLHDALLEAVLCGETGVTSIDLTRHYDQLITVSNGAAPIQEEFETLQAHH